MSSAAESTAARKAYEAYAEVFDGPMPTWDELGNLTQEAWRAAAYAGAQAVTTDSEARTRSAAEQMVDREDANSDPPTNQVARALFDALERRHDDDSPPESWDAVDADDQRELRVLVAELILGGHITPGRYPAPGQDKEGADLLELAWGLIANAGWDAHSGQVDLEKSPGWHEAALRWRDGYHQWLEQYIQARYAGRRDLYAYFREDHEKRLTDYAANIAATVGMQFEVEPDSDPEGTPTEGPYAEREVTDPEATGGLDVAFGSGLVSGGLGDEAGEPEGQRGRHQAVPGGGHEESHRGDNDGNQPQQDS